MKIIILIFIALLHTQLSAEADLKWVDEQIKAIKPSRTGVSNSFINRLKDPIKPLVKKTTGKSKTSSKSSTKKYYTSSKSTHKVHNKPLTLEAIMNNNAYINGKWYNVHDKVRGQKITLIDKDYVVLKYKKKKTRLFINNKNKKIKITTR